MDGFIKQQPIPVSTFNTDQHIKECSPVIHGAKVKPTKKQEENKMAYDKQNISVDLNVAAQAGRNLEAEAKDHLLRQLENAKDNWGYWGVGYRDLKKTFGLDCVEYPKSPEDFLERIQSKKYTLWTQEKFDKVTSLYEDDDCDCCRPSFDSFFSWRDPSVKEDREGFDAKIELIKKEIDRVRTIIIVEPATEGRKALEEFLAKDFTVN